MTITMAEAIKETQESPETENDGELKIQEDGDDETRENPETETHDEVKKEEDSDDETQQNPETETQGEVKKQEDNDDETQQNPETETHGGEVTKQEDSDGETQRNPETETHGEAKKQEDSDDQSSPRGVLEVQISGSDSDNSSTTSSSRSDSSSSGSSSSAAATEKSQSPANPDLPGVSIEIIRRSFRDKLKWKSFRRLSTFPFRRKLGRIQCADHEIDSGGDVTAPKPTWRSFTQAELVAATDNFSSEKLIGKGGHAEVYKGCLPDGEIVAVKRVTKKEKNDGERVGEFLSELGIIAHINHPNTAKLIGFSTDGDLHLVLEFSPHGSLASVLHGGTQNLDWRIRFKVAVGIAEGLRYLHCRCQRRMIHRDITASNILLTEDYEPQISDFGLAKWLPEKWPHHVVHPIEGTFGYMAPEYFMHGVANEKTDVFAYGVLLLELITGRRAIDSCQQSIVMWGKPLLETNNVKDIADPRLGEEYDTVEMKRAMLTSLACIHHLPTMRPNMNRVVELLRGEGGVTEVKLKSAGGKTLILETCDMEDYTATSYLNDLNRHRQLILE